MIIQPIGPARPTTPSWPSGKPPYIQGPWPSKGLVIAATYNSRVWWLDSRNVLHWVSTATAMQNYFQEKFYNTSSNTAFTGITSNSNPTGYLAWLAGCPIGANIDNATNPTAAMSKPWSYLGTPSKGTVMLGAMGNAWWLEPGGTNYGGTMHWIKNPFALLCNKYWPHYGWQYPPPTGVARLNVTWQQLDVYSIGPNIDH